MTYLVADDLPTAPAGERFRALGLDWARMAHDMEDPAVQAQFDANLKLAHELGIQGTPALVIGNDMVPGTVDLPELQKMVAEARRG
jgi:protein-disulfide isomerase